MGKKKSSAGPRGGKGGGKIHACAACQAPLVAWEGLVTVCCQRSYCKACTLLHEARDTCLNCDAALPRCEADSVALLRQGVARGNAEAQAMLGDHCMKGGEAKEAVALYRASAKQGHARAIFNLGRCYETGVGVAGIDECNSYEYYGRAAAMGYGKAQFNLGNAYRTGRGVDRDLVAAGAQYLLAAKQGNAEAQYNYALMRFNGLGCVVDKKRAIEYCKLAADQDYAPAVKKLPLWKMSPERKREAREPPPPSGVPLVMLVAAGVVAVLAWWTWARPREGDRD